MAYIITSKTKRKSRADFNRIKDEIYYSQYSSSPAGIDISNVHLANQSERNQIDEYNRAAEKGKQAYLDLQQYLKDSKE